MNRLLSGILLTLRSCLRSRRDLVIENLALRQQLCVLVANRPRPQLTPGDRVFWIVLRCLWSRWADGLAIVKPETVIRWHKTRLVSLPRIGGLHHRYKWAEAA